MLRSRLAPGQRVPALRRCGSQSIRRELSFSGIFMVTGSQLVKMSSFACPPAHYAVLVSLHLASSQQHGVQSGVLAVLDPSMDPS